MAGWSILTDGSALDCVEILRNLQSNGFCLNPDVSHKGDVDGVKDELGFLFDQFLSVFLSQISVSEDLRSLPAMLGDGRSVDLFKLFLVVREKGGSDIVSKNGLWASVADESGLGKEFVSSVKLIYTKYLETLDRWLQRTLRDKAIGGGLSHCDGNLGLSSMEFDSEFKDFLSHMSDQKKKGEEYLPLDSETTDSYFSLPETMDDTNGTKVKELDSGKIFVDEEEVVILDSSAINKYGNFRKRKRESLSGMLNWVTEIAKNPGNLVTVTSPQGGSNRKGCGVKEFHMQALLARQALLLRRPVYSSAAMSLLQKKHKMHPSMYEDHITEDNQSTERLRCSPRIVSLKKSCSGSWLKPSSTKRVELNASITTCMARPESCPKDRSLDTVDSLMINSVFDLLGRDHIRKCVPVGPRFQAEVPKWTGAALESDSKWLGTQVWPLKKRMDRSLIKRDPIGKGRQDYCGCPLPGSVECVRFLISEKRNRLKVELGPAFYHWKIDCMGEEVSLPWTELEEKMFKDIDCYWDQIFKCFPSKTRKDFVSYYFNVFLIRRRSYQNRVTPDNIDSEDDETESES